MPTNLELKAAIPSVAAARKAALDAGAAFHGAMRQTDTYFVVPHGRLKLREIDEREAELISYDRPETEQTRWSRYTKTPVAEAVTLRTMLAEALGVLVTVRKTRELLLLEGSRIHLDTVETLGAFLEFEVPVLNDDTAAAKRAMDRLRALFMVRDGDIFLHSYSDLLRSRAAGPAATRP